MPIAPADSGVRRLGLVGMTGVLLTLLATGCAADPTGTAEPAPTQAAPVPTAPSASAAPVSPPGGSTPTDLGAPAVAAAAAAPPEVVAGLQTALAERAAAVLGGDEAGFLDGLANGDPSFRAVQDVWFANLRQLPLQVYALAPDPATVVRTGPGSYWVNVQVTLQLQGFDAAPVTTVDRYLLESRRRAGPLRLASTSDAEWEARNAVQAPPWETTPLVVRSTPGVLGLFDARSEPASAPLLGSLQQGIDAVSALVPYPWARSVVVVALSDDAFLRSLPDLPGAGPESPEPDAVAFGVGSGLPAVAGGTPTTVGTRLALHPRLLGREGPGRDRLLRHELTHVALGERDDHAPLWLSEGLAELVSVQADPAGRRRVQPEAVVAAQAGVTELPAQAGFHERDVAAHYGVSWFACEYVAATAGPGAPWAVLEQLEALGAQSPLGVADAGQQDAVLRSLVGVNARTLARKAGKLLLTTATPPSPTAPPTPLPAPPPGTPPGAPAVVVDMP